MWTCGLLVCASAAPATQERRIARRARDARVVIAPICSLVNSGARRSGGLYKLSDGDWLRRQNGEIPRYARDDSRVITRSDSDEGSRSYLPTAGSLATHVMT